MASRHDIEEEEIEEGQPAAKVSFSEVFYATLRHWPWIVVSVFICVGLTALYVLCTPKTYTQNASLLVKDEENGGSSGAMSAIADLGLVKTNGNMLNEITNCQSRDLMEEAVRRLRVNEALYNKGFFKNKILYGLDQPVIVQLAGSKEESLVKFGVRVSRDGMVTLSGLSLRERKRGNSGEYKPTQTFGDKEYKGKLGSAISTPVGTVTVTPGESYSPEEDLDLVYEKSPVSAAVRSFSGKLAVELNDEDGTVLNLTMKDESDQRANDMLSTLIGLYNEIWIKDKNKVANSTDEFIAERLGVLEGELGNVDSDISAYKSANLVPDLKEASQLYMRQGEKTAEEIMKLGSSLEMSRYIKSYLSQAENYDKLLPANTGIGSDAIESQIAEYNRMMLQRSALEAKSSAQNPLVSNLDHQLRDQRKAIMAAVDNRIYDITSQLRASQASEAQTRGKIASAPIQSKHLLSIERQQKVKEQLYLYLLQKREENQLSKAFAASNTRVVNQPGDSGNPPTPGGMKLVAIAFLVGLVIPFGVEYIRAISDSKVRSRSDIEKLKVPFLGEIPRNPRRRKKDEEYTLVVKEGDRDVINESFRVLRTNVEFLKKNHEGAEVIAMTSFNAHSGKSFIAMNLGKVLSIKHKRVLVIDADMRHGSASEFVGAPRKGLSNYLNGNDTDLRDLIVPVEDSQYLFELPAGVIPPNPAELLERPEFSELIARLRKDYDYIIVDCPPIEVVADAHIVNPFVDRTIFVLRAGLLEKQMLPALEKLYEDKKYRNMSVILNYTAVVKGKFGGNKSYGYGYGYGYGYDYGNVK